MGMKNNPGIKRAGELTEFTPEQLLEVKKCMDDPVHFIKTYARIQHPTRGAIPFALYPYQERMIEAYRDNRYCVVLSARQTGKCCSPNTLINVILPPQSGSSNNVKQTITISKLHEYLSPSTCQIYDEDTNELKFIEQTNPHNVLVETPTGYSPIKHSHRTVPFIVWKIRTTSHMLDCADTHTVIDEFDQEIYVNNLITGDRIKTKTGIESITSIVETSNKDNMYDLELEDTNHVYYTNNILSHNSTVSAIYLLWYAMFRFDKTILIAANKNANAMEMISRIRYAYENIPNWLKPGVTDDGWNKHSLIFDNQSRILSAATSENTGRGFSISMLFLDEFAFVAPSIQEEFWTAISPTLATGGSCIMSSTPNGDANKFAQIWRSAEVGLRTITTNENLSDDDDGTTKSTEDIKPIIKQESSKFPFTPIRVKWDEPPDRDEDFKQSVVATLGDLKWRQEYECEFLSSDALLIDSQLSTMMELNRHPFLRKQNDFDFYADILPKSTYLIGVDPSTGTGLDFSVIQVYQFPSMNQVAEMRSDSMSSPEVYSKMKWMIIHLEKMGCSVYFSVENNGVGEGIIALYQNDEHPPVAEMISEEGKNRLGLTTTNKRKMRACLDFRLLVERGGIQINSPVMVAEIKSFARKRKSYEAQAGSTDDSIMATMICIRLLSELASYEQDAFEKLYSIDENEYTSEEVYDENEEPIPFLFGEGDETPSGYTPL